METGKLKWFNQGSGYGFIVPDDGGKDIFVHTSAVEKSGIDPKSLKDGDKLEYEIQEYKGKTSAHSLKKL